MTHDIHLTPWELRVQWTRSTEEFEFFQQRIAFPFLDRERPRQPVGADQN